MGLTLSACLVSSIRGAAGLSCWCLQGKRQKVSESQAQGTLSLLKGSCKPQGLPVLSCCIHPQQLRVGMHPGPHPSWGCCGAPPGAAVLGMDAEAPGIFQHAHGVPITPQSGSLLTLTGSGSCTGISFVTWGAGGWGTTRSIQPIIPLAAGSAEGSPAGKRPAAGVHTAQGTPPAPAAHAVSRAAQKGPWCPSVSTSCLGNMALQHSQTKPRSTPHPSPLL